MIIQKWSVGRCVFALLCCPDLVLIHHTAWIKDSLQELGMEQMSLMPPKPMFGLSLVCQSYDLEGWFRMMDSVLWGAGLYSFLCVSSLNGWFMGKVESWRVSKAQGCAASWGFFCLQCFCVITEQSELISTGVWGDKTHRFFAFSLFEAHSFANLCWWREHGTCQVELSHTN